MSKIGIVGKTNLEKTIAETKKEPIELAYPNLFKDVRIGSKFINVKNQTFKKVSSFAAHRPKVGLYTFGENVPVKIII